MRIQNFLKQKQPQYEDNHGYNHALPKPYPSAVVTQLKTTRPTNKPVTITNDIITIHCFLLSPKQTFYEKTLSSFD